MIYVLYLFLDRRKEMGAEDGGTAATSSPFSSMVLEYEEAESLLSREDPPETPYESKYRAREKLKSLLERCADHPAGDALAVNLLARLGAVDHEVEELSCSQEDLERALKAADGSEADGRFVMPVLVCLNQVLSAMPR